MNIHIKNVIQEIKDKIEYKKHNGPINVTVDQLWKYSGEIEEETENYKNLLLEAQTVNKFKKVKKCRKEYFKQYWLKQKLKQNL